MSKSRVMLTSAIDTRAHADTIISSLNTQLVGKDIFETHSLAVGTDEDGTPILTVDIRFNKEVDRNTIRDWIREQARDNPILKRWFNKATLSTHTCTHDDRVVQSCRETEYSVDFSR
jgi:hypothetical protein